MNKEQMKIEVSDETKHLTILHKTPIENFKNREGISVSGTIGLPLAHLKKETRTEIEDSNHRSEIILTPGLKPVIVSSYLTIDRDAMKIVFIENAGKSYQSSYTGALKLNPDFDKFGINSGTTYTPLELAAIIKMNRSFFESKSEAMKLVSVLMNFEAKVDKEVELKDNGRGDRRALKAQTVSTNIPENFKMNLPIFKGEDTVTFEVEIGIDPYSLDCSLISPEVNDIINETKNSVIDIQKDKIIELHPELRIFEL